MFDFQYFIKIYQKRFQKNRTAKRAFWTLVFLIFIAIFGNIIAAEAGKSLVPPLIPYASTTQDKLNNDFVSPLSKQQVSSLYYRHWLGTDVLGRDVLAGLIAGTRTALLVGVGSMAVALLIGLVLGLVAGYFGDNRLKVSIFGFLLRSLFFLGTIFYAFIFVQQGLNLFILFFILIGIYLIINILDNYLSTTNFIFFKKNIPFPIDLIIMRAVEVMQAIPTILWLLALISVLKSLTVTGLIFFIGITSWMSLARLIRGEIIRIRPLDFMESALALGLSDTRIMLRHALPNVMTPILIYVAFGIGSRITIEAFLTFIGFGLPLEQVTWGTMLHAAKDVPSAWWLIFFPGFMIFITVSAFNRIGEAFK